MKIIVFTKAQWGFGLYDFANSAYVLIFSTLLFPIYFREQIFLNSPQSDFYWGSTLSVSILLSIVMSPLIGYLADNFNRKVMLIFTIVIAVIGMGLLSLFPMISSFSYAILFVITHAFFLMSIGVYDSYISHVSEPKDRALISSWAWGLGYLGGIICFLIIYIALRGKMYPTPVAFEITTIFFLFFSLFSVMLLPPQGEINHSTFISTSSIILNKKFILLLLSFWLINDSIATIIYFTALFGRTTLHLDTKTIGLLFLFVQISAFPATWLMGFAAKKWGKINTILFTIFLWCLILMGLTFSTMLYHLIILSAISALVIGSTHALMRAFFSNIHPKELSGLTFGFYTIMNRTSALVGPLIFGMIATLTGNQRYAVVIFIFPLFIGGILFRKMATEYLLQQKV